MSSIKIDTPTVDNLSEGRISCKASVNSMQLKRPRTDTLLVNTKSQFSRILKSDLEEEEDEVLNTKQIMTSSKSDPAAQIVQNTLEVNN